MSDHEPDEMLSMLRDDGWDDAAERIVALEASNAKLEADQTILINKLAELALSVGELKARNARLLTILQKFRAAMDMHLGRAHEVAICEAYDLAHEAIAAEEKERGK